MRWFITDLSFFPNVFREDWRSTDNELLRVGLLRSRLDRTAWLDEILAEHAAVRELQSPGPGD